MNTSNNLSASSLDLTHLRLLKIGKVFFYFFGKEECNVDRCIKILSHKRNVAMWGLYNAFVDILNSL